MKKHLLAAMVAISVASFPAVAHHPAADNENMPDGTWDMIDSNLYEADSPHYYMDVNDMGSDTDRMNQSGEAELDRFQGGAQQANQAKSRDENSDGYGYQYQQAQGAVAPDTSIELSEAEVEKLLYMQEEEKLARDVYLALYDQWGAQIFKRISNAEQQHKNSVENLLNAYEIPYPADSERGEFSITELQEFYDESIDLGSGDNSTIISALEVGVMIEETDIIDLLVAMSETDNPAITQVYNKLLNGSYSHLRAFVSQIESLGLTYEPKLLSEEEAESILDGKQISSKISAGAAIDEDLNPEPTRSGFRHTVTTRSGKAGNEIEFDQEDPVTIASRFIPDDKDVGDTAECLVVAHYKTEEDQQSTFMRNGKGWESWDGDIKTLTSAQQCKLTAEEEVKIFEGELKGAPGQFNVFVGYRLKNNKIVYSAEPMNFKVK